MKKIGWRVSACDTRLSEAMNVDVSTTVQTQAGVVTEGMTVHEDDNVIGEEGQLTKMMTQLLTITTPPSLATPLSSHNGKFHSSRLQFLKHLTCQASK